MVSMKTCPIWSGGNGLRRPAGCHWRDWDPTGSARGSTAWLFGNDGWVGPEPGEATGLPCVVEWQSAE